MLRTEASYFETQDFQEVLLMHACMTSTQEAEAELLSVQLSLIYTASSRLSRPRWLDQSQNKAEISK